MIRSFISDQSNLYRKIASKGLYAMSTHLPLRSRIITLTLPLMQPQWQKSLLRNVVNGALGRLFSRRNPARMADDRVATSYRSMETTWSYNTIRGYDSIRQGANCVGES